ncbi:MAG: hypothetical protein M1833_002359 [Piccolia ochrophora]|nr:MAG: hypothetical protein M1833_002359 [Piccolia ochrophora]
MSISSQASNPSEGGAPYSWILDHILTYPGSYEIPLRTMYTLNSSPRAQPLTPLTGLARPDTPNTLGRGPSPNASPVSATHSSDTEQDPAKVAAAQFRTNLMAQIAQLPSQPCSLPPSFITAFVRRCFAEELIMVDFPQALTGMDYLRDLEMRRRREIASCLKRLNINKNSLGPDGEEKTSGIPALSAWVKSMEEKERKTEALYTQCYIGLRRWTLINEMSLLPFNKANCLAMLNTLYPPTISSQPTRQLTAAVLQSQRNGFFRYITGVERNGAGILENLMLQGRRAERGDENGWASVREVVDMYLRAANGVIDECSSIRGADYFVNDAGAIYQRRNGRKIDSGVDLSNDDNPSRSASSNSNYSRMTQSSRDKPLPPSPGERHVPPSPRATTALEKFARELRKIRAWKKPEPEKADAPCPQELRKMKSASTLHDIQEKDRSLASTPNHSRSETPHSATWQ